MRPDDQNAAILAAQILATADPDLRRRLRDHKAAMAAKVEEKNRTLKIDGSSRV